MRSRLGREDLLQDPPDPAACATLLGFVVCH
jgi:hypothetical protein